MDDNAALELWANILGSRFLCGLRLSDRTMRHREYRVVNLPASLRPSVAAAMVLLTNPGPDDVFVDPMCGSGTLLAERIQFGECGAVIGGDLRTDSCQASRKNLNSFTKPVAVLNWDARHLPLRSASVDGIATNLPFGKQIGSFTTVVDLYPRFFDELARVLKQDGTATILSSEFELVKDLLRQRKELQIVNGYSVAVLGQWGRIYIVKRQKM